MNNVYEDAPLLSSPQFTALQMCISVQGLVDYRIVATRELEQHFEEGWRAIAKSNLGETVYMLLPQPTPEEEEEEE